MSLVYLLPGLETSETKGDVALKLKIEPLTPAAEPKALVIKPSLHPSPDLNPGKHKNEHCCQTYRCEAEF